MPRLPKRRNPDLAATNKKSPGKGPTADRPRSSSVVYWALAVIALLGLADATYLTVAHLTGDDAVCGSALGCSTVLGSAYATIRGIPTAAFGAVAYFTVFSLAILAAFGYARMRGLLMAGGRADVRCLALFSLFAGFRLARLLSVLPFFGRADFLAGRIASGVSRRSLKLR